MKLEVIEKSPFYKSLIRQFHQLNGIGILSNFRDISDSFRLSKSSERLLWEELYLEICKNSVKFRIIIHENAEISNVIRYFDNYIGLSESELKEILENYLSKFLDNVISLRILDDLKDTMGI